MHKEDVVHPLIAQALSDGKQILVVCPNNTLWSPMFAALATKFVDPRRVTSAGWREVAREQNMAVPEWKEVCDKNKINLSAHRSQYVRDVDLTTIGVCVALGGVAAQSMRELGFSTERIIELETKSPLRTDPEGTPKAFLDCFHDLERKTAQLFGDSS